MLVALRRGLADFVSPETGSVYARTQLLYASTLLSALSREADGAVASLVKENAALRRLLRSAADAIEGARGDAALSLALRAGTSRPRLDLRLSALRQENARLLDLFIRAQAASEELAATARSAMALERRLRNFLRRRTEAQAASLGRR
jgi:hypothetical protein